MNREITEKDIELAETIYSLNEGNELDDYIIDSDWDKYGDNLLDYV